MTAEHVKQTTVRFNGDNIHYMHILLSLSVIVARREGDRSKCGPHFCMHFCRT